MIGTISKMRKINKLINLLINYTEKVYQLFLLLKLNMKICVKLSITTSIKRKMNLFHKYSHKLLLVITKKFNLYSTT